MKKLLIFFFLSSLSFAQNANRKFVSETFENGYTKILVSDGTYYIKIISDKIIETSFVPKGENFTKKSDLVVPVSIPKFDISSSNTQNELYEKAITFFDSYLNETGCPYFNKTEFYKNLYEKVYTNTSDTALFYKTNKLYYVKSDSIPSDAQFDIKNENEEILRAKIKFDCERLVYTSTNEKKELRFILKDLNKKDKTITLLVVYKDQKIRFRR